MDIWSRRLDNKEYNLGYGDALRDEVHNESITPLIGIFDIYSASLAARHFGGMFVSGFGFAASYYGLPDIGFIAWPDMVSFVQRLRLAFPQQHLLVDIDDGYVDPEVACHVVERLERIAASGVILEDQKRCGDCSVKGPYRRGEDQVGVGDPGAEAGDAIVELSTKKFLARRDLHLETVWRAIEPALSPR